MIFTLRPERVRIGILDFGLLAVDGVFIKLELARVCGVPGVRSFCNEPVWVAGGQAFSGGQDFALVVAWDSWSGCGWVTTAAGAGVPSGAGGVCSNGLLQVDSAVVMCCPTGLNLIGTVVKASSDRCLTPLLIKVFLLFLLVQSQFFFLQF